MHAMKWVELESDVHGRKLRAQLDVVAANTSILLDFKQ